MKRLECSGTNLAEIPMIPGLKELQCSSCTNLTAIPTIYSLQTLICPYCTRLTEIPIIPGLHHLHCYKCPWVSQNSDFADNIKKLIFLQKKLRRLYAGKKLEALSPQISEIYYSPGHKGYQLAKRSFYSASS